LCQQRTGHHAVAASRSVTPTSSDISNDGCRIRTEVEPSSSVDVPDPCPMREC
jgi:hypothetical protein